MVQKLTTTAVHIPEIPGSVEVEGDTHNPSCESAGIKEGNTDGADEDGNVPEWDVACTEEDEDRAPPRDTPYTQGNKLY